MTQDFTEDSYDPDHVADTDLENMENNFLTLKSLFSGSSSPANPVEGMGWYDTVKEILKLRTDTPAWIGVMQGDASQKIPVYRNDTMEGWLIDSGVTDCVIALKGGSQAYNVSAGQAAGTWTVGGLSIPSGGSHNHKWYDYRGGNDHQSYDSGGSDEPIPATLGSINYKYFPVDKNGSFSDRMVSGDMWTNNSQHTHTSANSDATWRVRAAMCTLQYLDL